MVFVLRRTRTRKIKHKASLLRETAGHIVISLTCFPHASQCPLDLRCSFPIDLNISEYCFLFQLMHVPKAVLHTHEHSKFWSWWCSLLFLGEYSELSSEFYLCGPRVLKFRAAVWPCLLCAQPLPLSGCSSVCQKVGVPESVRCGWPLRCFYFNSNSISADSIVENKMKANNPPNHRGFPWPPLGTPLRFQVRECRSMGSCFRAFSPGTLGQATGSHLPRHAILGAEGKGRRPGRDTHGLEASGLTSEASGQGIQTSQVQVWGACSFPWDPDLPPLTGK